MDFAADDKLYRLMKLGEERIEKELDIVKLVNSYRNLLILMKDKNMMDPQIKLRINNLGANVIDIDSDSYEAYKHRKRMKEKLVDEDIEVSDEEAWIEKQEAALSKKRKYAKKSNPNESQQNNTTNVAIIVNNTLQ